MLFIAALLLFIFSATAQSPWPAEKANQWYAHHRWMVGCNFTPGTAINQLEMWQAETFDPKEIDRELGWAEQIGFTNIRVFLHNLLMEEDPKGFLKRMNQFLDLSKKHHIGVTFVLFDSCWDPFPKPGKQHDPAPFVHNSGWVQSPGNQSWNILSNLQRASNPMCNSSSGISTRISALTCGMCSMNRIT